MDEPSAINVTPVRPNAQDSEPVLAVRLPELLELPEPLELPELPELPELLSLLGAGTDVVGEVRGCEVGDVPLSKLEPDPELEPPLNGSRETPL